MLQQDAINIAHQYLMNLNNGGIKISSAYLFGSYARNEANENSDIDILLISDYFDTDDDAILAKPWSPKYRCDFRIEPIAIGKKQFEADNDSLIFDIVRKEGIKINYKIQEY